MTDRNHYFAKRQRRLARFGRTCKVCGVRSHKHKLIGCLECAARKEKHGRPWSPEERDLLERHYRREFCWHLQKRLYSETGILRSLRALQKRAGAWKFRKDHQDGYTTIEAASMLGITKVAVNKAIREKRIVADGRGRDYRISYAEIDRLQATTYPLVPAHYVKTKVVAERMGVANRAPARWITHRGLPAIKHGKDWWIDIRDVEKMLAARETTPHKVVPFEVILNPIPAGWVSARVAARRLGYFPAVVSRLCFTGHIPGKKHNEKWIVPVAIVEAAERYLKKTGHTRIDWRALAADVAEKERLASIWGRREEA